MPKNESDPEDPLELNGVALLTNEDTHGEMVVCFTEEFMRLGYNASKILALFRDPFYIGPSMVTQEKGEAFVHDIISETFKAWNRECDLTPPQQPQAEDLVP